MLKYPSCLVLIFASMISTSYAQDTSKDSSQKEDPPLIDEFREGVTDTVNASARWIDSLFADEIDPDAYNTASGSLTITPEWDEHDGFSLDSSFRAKVVFPHAKRRFSAIIGRGTFDDFINDTQTTRPSVIRRDRSDEEWMLGLGFDPYVKDHHNLSFGAGIRGGIKMDPYVRARYRYETIITEDTELRVQSVAFWRDSDGFGVSQTFSFDTAISDHWFNKAWVRGTFAERTEGVRWHFSEKLYYMYHHERAIGGEVWWYGETKEAIPLQDYGVRALHRSRYSRDWLYFQTWVGLHWPRETIEEVRKPRWLVGFEVEMLFGN